MTDYAARFDCIDSVIDFSQPDLIPMGTMNEIIWKSVRGVDSQMPAVVHAPYIDTSTAGTDPDG